MARFKLARINLDNLDEDVLGGVCRVNNLLRKEVFPDEEPRSLEETRERMDSIPQFVDLQWWGAFVGGLLVGHGNAETFDIEGNRHLAEVSLAVDPDYRRRGIGCALLAELIEYVKERERSLIIGHTHNLAAGGEQFARSLEAQAAQQVRISRLDLSGLDTQRMRSWTEQGGRKASDFELWFVDGPYPRDAYDRIIEVLNVMNTAPRDALEIEDWLITPAQLEQIEAARARRKGERWTLFAKHRPSGKLAGVTEVFFDRRHPQRLDQGDTAVDPQFRGRGLGRWLKGAMALRIVEELPAARFVYTGNAGSNAAMLRINEEMGFRPYLETTVWQIKLDGLEDRLTKKAASPAAL